MVFLSKGKRRIRPRLVGCSSKKWATLQLGYYRNRDTTRYVCGAHALVDSTGEFSSLTTYSIKCDYQTWKPSAKTCRKSYSTEHQYIQCKQVMSNNTSTAHTKSNQLTNQLSRPHIRQEYPLNLSILLSGGKESKSDFPSNGEWTGISLALRLNRIVNFGLSVYYTV